MADRNNFLYRLIALVRDAAVADILDQLVRRKEWQW
jgi:hypothetical protein